MWAVHIDYGNRPESQAEAQFVEQWCLRHGVSLRVRTITELKRNRIANREEYVPGGYRVVK